MNRENDTSCYALTLVRETQVTQRVHQVVVRTTSVPGTSYAFGKRDRSAIRLLENAE